MTSVFSLAVRMIVVDINASTDAKISLTYGTKTILSFP
jgi:hypothetical protein